MHQQTAVALAELLFARALDAAAAPGKPAPTPAGDHAVYEPKYRDSVLEAIEVHDREVAAQQEQAMGKIRAEQTEKREAAEKDERVLRFDMSHISRPANPAAFTQAFHFPPVAQYLTGKCWSFSTSSFYESEVYSLTCQKIKLSEIWTMHWAYVEKMRRFVRERGDFVIAEGSESNPCPGPGGRSGS